MNFLQLLDLISFWSIDSHLKSSSSDSELQNFLGTREETSIFGTTSGDYVPWQEISRSIFTSDSEREMLIIWWGEATYLLIIICPSNQVTCQWRIYNIMILTLPTSSFVYGWHFQLKLHIWLTFPAQASYMVQINK